MASSETRPDEQRDIRPVVAAPDKGNRPLWIGLGVILFTGMLLFSILEARRQTVMEPVVRASKDDLAYGSSSEPPALYIPPSPPPPLSTMTQAPAEERISGNPPSQALPPMAAPPAMLPALPPAPTDAPPVIASIAPTGNSPLIVFDASSEAGVSEGTAPEGATNAPAIAKRAQASRIRNRSTIVPQGTLIPAVLETALDSTQPGQVRAIVSSNVANMHGNHILIPRGSRLFGEYKGDIAAGQKRAFVQWTRLVRPDGVTIAIDSPAADRLGRAGIKGNLNTHFMERLGGALLQSTIDIGTMVASRRIYDSGSVILALPGGVQGTASQVVGTTPKPTLKVRQGTSISVFVMRDLDFTAVEGRR